MSPSEQHQQEAGWISSEQLILPRQTLEPEQVEAFLEHMFADIAHRPKPLRLREGVAVARYLTALARTASPQDREMLEPMARMIELTALQFTEIKLASKAAVLNLLKSHAQTHLVSRPVDHVMELVRTLSEPTGHEGLFRSPQLMSRRRSFSGMTSQGLQDDLTQQIFAAYGALRRTGVRNARGRIATVLNRLGLRTRAREKTSQLWGPAEVAERVRDFRNLWMGRIRKAMKFRAPEQEVDAELLRQEFERRVCVVDGAIHGYHAARSWDRYVGPSPTNP